MRIRNVWLGFHLGHQVQIRAIAATYCMSPQVVSPLLSLFSCSVLVQFHNHSHAANAWVLKTRYIYDKDHYRTLTIARTKRTALKH
ncbi:hypothetical protein Hanom_Chr15g01361621 [Helianthus anomalus]